MKKLLTFTLILAALLLASYAPCLCPCKQQAQSATTQDSTNLQNYWF